MKTLGLKDFLKIKELKDDTMIENEMKRVHNNSIYPTDFEIKANKRFVKIDNGRMGGTHWTCFYIKDNKPFFTNSFGGAIDKFYLTNYQNQYFIINKKFKVKLSIMWCVLFEILLPNRKKWILPTLFSKPVWLNQCQKSYLAADLSQMRMLKVLRHHSLFKNHTWKQLDWK